MGYNSLVFLTEEEKKMHEEFRQCQNEKDLKEFMKKVEVFNESHDNTEIPHFDMTYKEFLEQYHCVDSEEIRRRYGVQQ